MLKYMCFCEICKIQLKDSPNALSNHLHHSHKDTTKEEYYAKYIDNRSTCLECGSSVKFRGIQLGYSEYCTKCSVKIKQWNSSDGDTRKEILRNRMQKNTFSTGRPKGSKNKNPYPIDSPLVRERMRLLFEHLHQIDHWHNMNVEWWDNATDDQKTKRINNIMNGKLSKSPQYITEELTDLGKYRLSVIFNIPYEDPQA